MERNQPVWEQKTIVLKKYNTKKRNETQNNN